MLKPITDGIARAKTRLHEKTKPTISNGTECTEDKEREISGNEDLIYDETLLFAKYLRAERERRGFRESQFQTRLFQVVSALEELPSALALLVLLSRGTLDLRLARLFQQRIDFQNISYRGMFREYNRTSLHALRNN
jgi:hypothetical protein